MFPVTRRPPTRANPPCKRPLLTLMRGRRGRASTEVPGGSREGPSSELSPRPSGCLGHGCCLPLASSPAGATNAEVVVRRMRANIANIVTLRRSFPIFFLRSYGDQDGETPQLRYSHCLLTQLHVPCGKIFGATPHPLRSITTIRKAIYHNLIQRFPFFLESH